jgi:DNA repair protein RecO (recombination protein O)
MRVHVYKTEAIVLDRKDFGEADRLLTLYTPGLGKVRAIAKGARRTTSRLSGHIELFTHTALFLAQGRNLDIVTQSQLIHSHERLREDLWRAALGFHILELVNHFSEERLESPPVWYALLEALRRLDADEPVSGGQLALAEARAEYAEAAADAPRHVTRDLHPELGVRFFEAQLLDHTGYRPELRCCTLCRERLLPLENYFHAPSGGILCPHCAAGHAGLLPLSVDAVKVLRLLQDGDYGLASRLRLNGGILREMETVMRRHISHVLERDLRTAHLVDEVRVLG